MPTPAALAALAIDPNFAMWGTDANYTAPGGAPLRCRVIRRQPDRTLDLGFSGRPVIASDWVEVRKSEIAAPAAAGVFALLDDAGNPTGVALEVQGDPTFADNDDMRLVWLCTVR